MIPALHMVAMIPTAMIPVMTAMAMIPMTMIPVMTIMAMMATWLPPPTNALACNQVGFGCASIFGYVRECTVW